MIKYISDLEKNSLVSSDLYSIGKLCGQVWLCFFLVPKFRYQLSSCGHFSSVEDCGSRNSSACSSAIKFFHFFLVLVITN